MQSKTKTDTSAMEARNGKDIQGIPWERLNFSRDNYRETRLNQYINYESLSLPRGDLEKVLLDKHYMKIIFLVKLLIYCMFLIILDKFVQFKEYVIQAMNLKLGNAM